MRLRWLGLAAYLACGAVIIMFTAPAAGWRALSVATPSMKPHLSPGTLVLVHRTSYASLQPGEVITYKDPHHQGVTITHRIVSKTTMHGSPALITKGDANPTVDPSVPASSVVGRVSLAVPLVGRALSGLRVPWVLLLLVILPGLVVIWTESKRLRRLLSLPSAATSARRLRVDGLYRPTVWLLALTALAVLTAAGTTLAATSTASLTGNFFTVGSTATPTPSPSASPTVSPTPSTSATPSPTGSPGAAPCSGNVTISNTGPGSTNTVTCTNVNIHTSNSRTNVSVTNR